MGEPRRGPKLGSHQNSCKTNTGSRSNPPKGEQKIQIVQAHSHGKLPAGPRTVLLFEKHSCSTSHIGKLGRRRVGIWASENAPRLQEIDFLSKICEIQNSLEIALFCPHLGDLDPAPGFLFPNGSSRNFGETSTLAQAWFTPKLAQNEYKVTEQSSKMWAKSLDSTSSWPREIAHRAQNSITLREA